MNIAILTGGISTERAVALRSGANMKAWVQNAWHQVTIYDLPEEVDIFLGEYKQYGLIIPVFHGRYWEDGVITGMCETLWLKVAWCSSGVHALCMDKYHTNCIVEKIGIKIPKSWIPGLPPPPKLLPIEWEELLNQALIVKPNQWWSSLATTKARSIEEFRNWINAVNEVIESLTKDKIELLGKSNGHFIRQFPSLSDVPLVQECIEWREFTVGVYRDESWIHILPIMEIMPLKSDFFDYEEKYESDGSNEVFVELEEDLKKYLELDSSHIYEHLRCRWIIRIDWRYDGKDIYFLEVNTIPGFTAASFVPKMWKKAGKTENEFIDMLHFSSY